MTGWPTWLDAAEASAARVDTCLEHMRPFRVCLRGHLVRAALKDLWRALCTAIS